MNNTHQNARVGQSFFRVKSHRQKAPRPRFFTPAVTRASDAALMRGVGEPRQLATILCEDQPGQHPTIVLGGFVPDSTEQVFLLRRMLFQSGSVYYLNYSRRGFSLELLCAQLDDLVEELTVLRGQRPVIFTVSFGGGLLVEWLRRDRAGLRPADIAGTILVSPVACVGDVLDPAESKPATLTARALKPYFDPPGKMSHTVVERSQAIFSKMFNAGAQNRDALLGLMNADEIGPFLEGIMVSIKGLDFAGASERVRALGQFVEPDAWSAPDRTVLTEAPTLILYAESEGTVLTGNSPTRAALNTGLMQLFPKGECRVVTGGASPVQHASLIFHHHQFLPHVANFYKNLKAGKVSVAA
jgi:pimeloyl-ACP methyl ester carboxylesterase